MPVSGREGDHVSMRRRDKKGVGVEEWMGVGEGEGCRWMSGKVRGRELRMMMQGRGVQGKGWIL